MATPEEGFNYIKQAAEKQASTTKDALAIHDLMDQQSATYSDAILTQKSAGSAVQSKLAAEDSINASVDAQVAAMQKTLGTDWTDSASATSKWAKELQDNTAKAYAALDVVKEQQSKSLVNDPVGYIMSSFTLPGDIAVYNTYARKAQIAEGALQEIVSLSNAGAIAANNMKQLTSTELAIAKAKEAAAASQLQVNKLELDAAGTRISGIEKLNALDQQQTALAFQIHSAQNSDAQLRLQEENGRFMREQRLAAQKAIEEKRADAAADMEAYNLGAKRVNSPIITDLKTFQRMHAAQASNPRFTALIAAGQQLALRGGNSTGIPVAQDAGHAAELYVASGSNLLANPTGRFLADRFNEVKLRPGAATDRDTFMAQVTSVAQKRAESDLKVIKDTEPNLYDAPPLGVMAQIKAVADDKFFQQHLAPILNADKTATLNNSQILLKAMEASKASGDYNGTVKSIATYYEQAVLQNAAMKQFLENGLPPQKSFIVSFEGRNFDLTKETDIRRAFLLKGAVGMGFNLNAMRN